MSKRFSDVNTKDDLLNVLLSLRSAGIYDIFSQTCLHEFIKKWHIGQADPDSLTTQLPEGKITLREFIESLNKINDKAAVETKRNANSFLTRNLLKETFRITQSFCYLNKKMDILKGQPWYQFARIVVNSISHNFRFEFKPNDIKLLPVKYKGEIIDSSMDGKPISMKLEILLNLIDDIIFFVKEKL
jgi:hypothetical protein